MSARIATRRPESAAADWSIFYYRGISNERSKNWPDAPTLKELGYPFVFDSPFGIAGPKGMDAAVVQKLHDAFKTALEEKPVIDMMAKYDMVPRYIDTAGYRKSVEEFIVSEKAALEKIGLAKKE